MITAGCGLPVAVMSVVGTCTVTLSGVARSLIKHTSPVTESS